MSRASDVLEEFMGRLEPNDKARLVKDCPEAGLMTVSVERHYDSPDFPLSLQRTGATGYVTELKTVVEWIIHYESRPIPKPGAPEVPIGKTGFVMQEVIPGSEKS